MMFKPLEPRAGPTGGEGFAAPPLICSFTYPVISFAIFLLEFFYLYIINLNGCITAKYFNHNVKLFLFFKYFFYAACESAEWSIHNFYGFAYNKRSFKYNLTHLRIINCAQYSIYLRLTKWNWFFASSTFRGTQEAENTRNTGNHVGSLTMA